MTTRPGDVADYYDRNTRRFLLVGRTGGSHGIHRLLWGPGVDTIHHASIHVNQRLADEIRRQGFVEPRGIVDLGCGVGGTLFHLAGEFPSCPLEGITISPRQVEIAERIAEGLDLGARCSFVLGNFEQATGAGGADVVVAVESFVHSARRPCFFASAREHLRPGGVLLVVDDFLAREPDALDAGARDLVDTFREGWRVPALCTPQQLRKEAATAGFDAVRSDDLTPLVRTGRPRDRVIALLAPGFQRMGFGSIPFFGNMIGGDALQRGIRSGVLHYRMEVLRRR